MRIKTANCRLNTITGELNSSSGFFVPSPKNEYPVNFNKPISKSTLLFKLLRHLIPLFTPALIYSLNAADETEDTPLTPSNNQEAIVSEKDSVKLVDDSSVGEAIQRRPDLGFANITIDGEDSNISLDSISSDSVESVEVMKSVTPDLDADSRGGSIALTSKPAYEQSSVSYKGSAEYRYNSLFEQPGYAASFAISGPINKRRTLGGQISVNLSESTIGNQTVSQDWTNLNTNESPEYVLEEVNREIFRQDSEVKEMTGGLNWKMNDVLSFFLRSSYKERNTNSSIPEFEYRFSKGEYIANNSTSASIQGAEATRSLLYWDGFNERIESAVGFSYKGTWLDIDAKLTYKDNTYEEPDFFFIEFVQTDLDFDYSLDNPLYPTIRIRNNTNLSDYSDFYFEDFNSQHWLNNESDLIGSLNLKWSEVFGQKDAYLKLGFKSRFRDREQISDDNVNDGFDGSFSLSDVLSEQEYSSFLEGRYQFGNFPNYKKTKDFIEQNEQKFVFNERRTRERADPNTYLADEQVNSIYTMYNWERGKWRSIIGWRIEDTTVTFDANEVLVGKNNSDEIIYLRTNPTTGESSYQNNFPNAHFRFRAKDWLTIIGSFTNTIKRPDYSSVVPYREVNIENNEISEGNPNLKPTLFTNWDLSFDIKIPQETTLSVELFNRSIDDFIFRRKSIVDSGLYQGFELRRSENSSNADIVGAKITLRQNLKIKGLPDGLSWNINYIQQQTEIEYPARPGEILELTNAPESELKVTLNYESEKYFVQLKYSHSDSEIIRVASTPNEDLYNQPSTELDLNLNYRLNPKTRLFIDIENLTNDSSFARYEGSPHRPTGYRTKKWTGAMGVKFDL